MSTRPARQRTHDQQQEFALLVLIGGALVAAAIAALIPWTLATTAAWMHSGQLASLTLSDSLHAALSGELWTADPASAYPAAVRRLLPGAWGFWTAAALASRSLAGDDLRARPRASRDPHEPPERRPALVAACAAAARTTFGRYRTVKRPDRPRAAAGPRHRRHDRAARLARGGHADGADGRAGRAAYGQELRPRDPGDPRARGPGRRRRPCATDVVQHTLARRRRLGRVWVWDPFGAETDAWDLLQGCEDWEHALLVARWLGRAMQPRRRPATSPTSTRRPRASSRPCLHAAALTETINAPASISWILDPRPRRRPTRSSPTSAPRTRATACTSVYAYTERQRDGILGTAAMQLKAYGHPAAARTAPRARGHHAEDLFDGARTRSTSSPAASTSSCWRRWSSTMLSSLLYWLSEHENRTGAALDPPALFALDETASIAPIEDLPQILATSLGSGVRFLTVWHSVAQIRQHFGADAAAEILALSQAKVFMGSITDRLHAPRDRRPARPAAPGARRPHAAARRDDRAGAAAHDRGEGLLSTASCRRSSSASAATTRPDPAGTAAAMTTRRPHRLAARAAAILGNDDALLTAARARLGERVHAAVILDVGAGILSALLPRRSAEQLLLAVTDDDIYLLECQRRTLAPKVGGVRHRVPRASLVATWKRRRVAITAELSCPEPAAAHRRDHAPRPVGRPRDRAAHEQ